MPNEIVIEIDAPRNNYVLFRPAPVLLRSRWTDLRVPSGLGTRRGLRDIKDVPGQRIGLDVQTRKGRIFDPLATEEYRGLRQQIANIWPVGGITQSGERTVELDASQEFNLGQDQVATWWYWMKRFVETPVLPKTKIMPRPEDVSGPLARIVEGSFGKQPPGLIQVNWDAHPQSPRFKHEFVGGMHPIPGAVPTPAPTASP